MEVKNKCYNYHFSNLKAVSNRTYYSTNSNVDKKSLLCIFNSLLLVNAKKSILRKY